MSGFQTFVQQQPAIGVEGDFASTNPRASVPPVIGGAFKVAPGQSVRVGYFAWANQQTGLVYSSAAAAGSNAVMGFVARQPNEPSVVITQFLGESRMTLEAGMPVTLMATGDYYANLPGADAGEFIYADPATGAPTLSDGGGTNPFTQFKAASQAKVNAVTANTTTIAATTGIMTVATVNSGTIEVGQRVTGAGVPANTYITAQLTGTPGGAGTYQTTSVNRPAVPAFAATMVQGGLAKITSTGPQGPQGPAAP